MLFQPQKTNLNPIELMNAVKNYSGTPDQARAQAMAIANEMGMSKEEFERKAAEAKQLASILGL